MARAVVIAFVLVMVVPMFLGGVGLVVMLAGRLVRIDLSPVAIIALSAVPTAWLSWKLYGRAMEFTYR